MGTIENNLLAKLALRGRSQTMFTIFWFFFDHLPPCVYIFYGMNVYKTWTFLDHLPTSSCKRSLWTTPYRDSLTVSRTGSIQRKLSNDTLPWRYIIHSWHMNHQNFIVYEIFFFTKYCSFFIFSLINSKAKH